MHTVEILDQAIATAERCGLVVRQDWFGGATSGACELKGRRWVFIDLALTPREQLDQILTALREMPNLAHAEMSPQLQRMLRLPKAA